MPDAAADFVPPLFAASSDDDAAANDNVALFGPAILRAERRLRDLERLTRIGMDISEALHDRVLTAGVAAAEALVNSVVVDDSAKSPARKPPPFDPTDAFAKISRVVRLTINLETKADDALRALQSGQFLARETRKAERTHRQKTDMVERSDTARDIVDKRVSAAIDREALNETDYCDLMEALKERLDEDSVYLDLDDRPLRETVERLCTDLGLSPDWSRWIGDDWIDDGPPKRWSWSIFNTPSRKPLFANGEPDTPDD